MNLTVANSLQNVIAFGDCNTGTKLFICSTEIKSCCFQASCSSCPFSLSSCLLFGLRFIRVVPLTPSVRFACRFSRCIRSPSQVTDVQSVQLLPVCPPSTLQTLSAKIRGQRAKCCSLFLLWEFGPVQGFTLGHKQWPITDFKWHHMWEQYKSLSEGGYKGSRCCMWRGTVHEAFLWAHIHDFI